MTRAVLAISVFMLLVGAVPLVADEPPPPAPCSAPEHRQFDFWIGDWQVVDADGQVQGTNRITQVAGDCALREEWVGNSGVPGTSINYFDPADGLWHQHWVGGSGSILDLTGGLQNGSMVLEGERDGPRGHALHRIAWTPLDDGRVRQSWTLSRDEGTTWQPVFEGFYSRKP